MRHASNEEPLRLAPKYGVKLANPYHARCYLGCDGEQLFNWLFNNSQIKTIGDDLDLNHAGLVSAIDRRLQLLKTHFQYFESDHVLNIAYNALSGGRCLEDLELKRNDEAYLNLIGATRIPAPTTAGDFCRRFKTKADIDALHDAIDDAIDDARRTVWARQPQEFFERAVVDKDGHTVETTGECKEGMDINYESRWARLRLRRKQGIHC